MITCWNAPKHAILIQNQDFIRYHCACILSYMWCRAAQALTGECQPHMCANTPGVLLLSGLDSRCPGYWFLIEQDGLNCSPTCTRGLTPRGKYLCGAIINHIWALCSPNCMPFQHICCKALQSYAYKLLPAHKYLADISRQIADIMTNCRVRLYENVCRTT